VRQAACVEAIRCLLAQFIETPPAEEQPSLT